MYLRKEMLIPSTQPPTLALLASIAIVLIAAWNDWRNWRIPNSLIAGGIASALMLAIFTNGGIGIRACLMGGTAGLLFLLPFYFAKGMGAGDVKLLATIGMLTGPKIVISITLVTFLIGGVWSLAVLAGEVLCFRRYRPWIMTRHQHQCTQTRASPKLLSWSRGSIPYGVVIALGTLITLLII